MEKEAGDLRGGVSCPVAFVRVCQGSELGEQLGEQPRDCGQTSQKPTVLAEQVSESLGEGDPPEQSQQGGVGALARLILISICFSSPRALSGQEVSPFRHPLRAPAV
jgi:hypothetical protein